MVAEALDGQIVEDEEDNEVLDITLGYYIVVKCELIVQLLIPAYDYCPVPREACEENLKKTHVKDLIEHQFLNFIQTKI